MRFFDINLEQKRKNLQYSSFIVFKKLLTHVEGPNANMLDQSISAIVFIKADACSVV